MHFIQQSLQESFHGMNALEARGAGERYVCIHRTSVCSNSVPLTALPFSLPFSFTFHSICIQQRPRIGTAESRLEVFDEIEEPRSFGTQGGILVLSNKDLVQIMGAPNESDGLEPLEQWEIAGSVDLEGYHNDTGSVEFICSGLLPFSLYRVRFRAENAAGVSRLGENLHYADRCTTAN